MQISPNFSLAEMTVTRSHHPNVPDAEQIEAMKQLAANVLEPLRAWARTKKPDAVVKVNSAFRSAAVNRDAGGAIDSQHLFGEAADVVIEGVDKSEMWHFIVDELKTFDQVIAEYLNPSNPDAGWIHVSYRKGRLRRSAISCIARGDYRPGLVYVGGVHA